MKWLIFGLGNIGREYENTRHNVGFMVLDALAKGQKFRETQLATTCTLKYKECTFLLFKPTTYMNLSGRAVQYHMHWHKVTPSQIVVVTDDIALPLGAIRLRSKGSDGGHNGLKSIQQHIGTTEYPRLRVGIGKNFESGEQVKYVLSPFSEGEQALLQKVISHCCNALLAIAEIPLEKVMTLYNRKIE
ncbi:MAG: aminoacyl-tRNA hydrolase [Bacteroidia bacterium]|nr:aminoacyl-tRNA hydrolase [Bacteroidia bacterium]MDW8157543.1 aminoacyl-tRNA hydrolase [Bacteroidia bacterium]